MSKCTCYYVKTERIYTYHTLTGRPIVHDVDVGVCWGTRERDPCSCEGNMEKCDFYPTVREKEKKKQRCMEKKDE